MADIVTAERVLMVESIAAGGDGVCRDEGLVVFVPRSAPGDIVRVSYRAKGGFARGRILSIESPSSERVDPPCDHYVVDRCGGCQLQHMEYDAQLRAKERIVMDAFQRIGKRAITEVVMHASPDPWRYRRRLTLGIRREGERVIAGLHRHDNPTALFELRDCLITGEDVLAAWRGILQHAQLLPQVRQLRGSVLQLGGALHFLVEGGDDWDDANRFRAACGFLSSVWWTPRDGERELIGSDDGDLQPGASFAQVNEAVEKQVRAHVLAAALVRASVSVIDAYAGAGYYSRALAAHGANVIAIESDGDALAAIPDSELSRVLPVRGLVEREIDRFLPADLVVLNPPRAGVDASVTAALE
jgi:23S rRNA (uracil1939-C5)-methyltransferase